MKPFRGYSRADVSWWGPRLIAVSEILRNVAVAVAGVAVGGAAFYAWPVGKRIDAASAQLLQCTYRDQNGVWRGNGACLQASILGIVGAVKTSSGAIGKAAPEISAAVKESAVNSVSASQKTVELLAASTNVVNKLGGTVDAATKTVKDLDQTVNDLDGAVKALAKAASPLLTSADSTMQAATGTLNELTALEKQLGEVIGKDNEQAIAILEQMLKIMDDSDIQGILANVDAATKSGSEIINTVDIATRALRAKAGVVKALINKLIGMISLPIPLL